MQTNLRRYVSLVGITCERLAKFPFSQKSPREQATGPISWSPRDPFPSEELRVRLTALETVVVEVVDYLLRVLYGKLVASYKPTSRYCKVSALAISRVFKEDVMLCR